MLSPPVALHPALAQEAPKFHSQTGPAGCQEQPSQVLCSNLLLKQRGVCRLQPHPLKKQSEAVNIDGYHQMSLLYKVIPDAHGRLEKTPQTLQSPTLWPLLALSSPGEGSTRGAAAVCFKATLKQRCARLWFGEGTTVHHASFCFRSAVFMLSFIF